MIGTTKDLQKLRADKIIITHKILPLFEGLLHLIVDGRETVLF